MSVLGMRQVKQIHLKISPELLSRVDQAAESEHLDRSNWIRTTLHRATAKVGNHPLFDVQRSVDR